MMRLAKLPPVAIVAAVAVLLGVLFIPIVDFPFVYDDVKQILRNSNIQGWHGYSRAFLVDAWSFDEFKSAGVYHYYRPILGLWLTTCWLFFSQDPFGYHAMGVVWHVGVGASLFYLGSTLGINRRAVAIAVAIYLLHPIHIQATMLVAAIGDPIMAASLLWMCSFWLLAETDSKSVMRRSGFIAAGLVCALIAALTIERAWPYCFLPAVLVWFKSRNVVRSFRTAALCGVPISIVMAVRMAFLPSLPPTVSTATGWADSLPFAPVLALRYLENLAVPLNLSLAYPDAPDTIVVWRLLLGLLLSVGLVVVMVYASRKNPPRQFLAFATLLPGAPVLLARVLNSPDFVQDRYLYLPVAFGALWAADVVAGLWHRDSAWQKPIAGILVVWSMVLLSCFPRNLAPWSDDVELYRRTNDVAPNTPKYLMNLSNALRRKDPAADPGCRLLIKAKKLEETVSHDGEDAVLAFNTGNCHRLQGQLLLSLPEYDLADRLSNGSLHLARRNKVVALMALDRLAESLFTARSLTRDYPKADWSWHLQGVVLARSGRLEEAAASVRNAIQLDPENGKNLALLEQIQRSIR